MLLSEFKYLTFETSDKIRPNTYYASIDKKEKSFIYNNNIYIFMYEYWMYV